MKRYTLVFFCAIATLTSFSQTIISGGVNHMSNAGYGLEFGVSADKFGGYFASTVSPKASPLVDGESGGSESLGYRWSSSKYHEETQVSMGMIYNSKIHISYMLGVAVSIYNNITIRSEETYYYGYDLGTSSSNDIKLIPLLEGKIRYNLDFVYIQAGATKRGVLFGIGFNFDTP